jgi:hypothetical protein
MINETRPSDESLGQKQKYSARQEQGYKALLLLVGALMWLSLLFFPGVSTSTSLDPSWQQCMGYFATHHFLAGKDYIFTYGPLGYLMIPSLDNHLFWHRYLWELGSKFFFTYLLMRISAPLKRSYRIVLLVSITLFSVLFELPPDAVYFLMIFMAAFILLSAEELPAALLILCTALFGILSLMKGTMTVYVIIILLLLEVKYRRRHFPLYLSPLLLFAMIFVAAWLVCGQSLALLPAYFRGLQEIVAGYDPAMEVGPNRNFFVLIVVVMMPIILLFLSSLFLSVDLKNKKQLAMGAMLIIMIGFSFKQAVVRGDLWHFISFFPETFIIGFTVLLLPVRRPALAKRRTGLVGAGVLLSGFGLVLLLSRLPVIPGLHTFHGVAPTALRLGHTAAVVVLPFRTVHQNALEQLIVERDVALPRIRAYVKDGTIDAVCDDQGILLLNHFNYHPRPIFQSYSAYTLYLLDLNAQFFAGREAPDYILYKLETLDNRFPPLDDNAAFLQILERYSPVMAEDGHLLLKRNLVSSLPMPNTRSVEGTAHFGESIDIKGLPDGFHTISVAIQPSILGKIKSALFHGECVSLKVTTINGTDHLYRLVPAMARREFLIDPLVESTEDVRNLFEHTAGNKIDHLMIVPESRTEKWFEASFSYRINTYPELVANNRKDN